VSHFNAALERVTEVRVRLESVSVPSPNLLVGYVAGLLQTGDDPLGRSFGDSDLRCNVACSDSGVVCDQDQDSCVVSEEGPGFVH